MPVAIPDRFRLEVRLGRDGDIEEWLAPTRPDRPVLIRPRAETSAERRREFVTAVQKASAVSHFHLGHLPGRGGRRRYWCRSGTGRHLRFRLTPGTPSSRKSSSPTLGVVPGAGRVAQAGVVHGGIDLSAITYTVAHPAKLGLSGAIPGADPTTTCASWRRCSSRLTVASRHHPPSEAIDGLSSDVDRILRAGAPQRRQPRRGVRAGPDPAASPTRVAAPVRRLLLTAMALVVAAGLVGWAACSPQRPPHRPSPCRPAADPRSRPPRRRPPLPDPVDPPALERRHGVVGGDLRPVRRRRRERRPVENLPTATPTVADRDLPRSASAAQARRGIGG